MIFKRLFSTNLVRLNKIGLSNNPILPKKSKNEKTSMSQHFVDFKVTTVKAGNGGDGFVSFMHLKENEWAGPDGGDGGNGAHVIFKAEPGLKSLNKIKSMYNAEDGETGRSYNMKGKGGEHLVVKVPVGTVLKTQDGQVCFDFKTKTSKFIAARGGAGGKGNSYYLANDNKRPMQFEHGHKGEKFTYNVELNLIADAALVGYPNVGKSSLLNALTRARPKIGDYSFTTLHPHVGVVEFEDFEQITIADLPGLLPDLTRGFGTKFLYHLERCKIILIVIDASRNDLYEQYVDIKNILNSFDSSILAKKPSLVLANKIDCCEGSREEMDLSDYDKLNEFKQKVNDDCLVVPVSALEKINLAKFSKLLRNLYENLNKND